MDSWIKNFCDKTKEIGTDKAISEGKRSWTKGRQDNICSVDISFESQFARLVMDSEEWYQFDRYLNVNGETEKTYRILQSKISKKDIGNFISIENISYRYIEIYNVLVSKQADKKSFKGDILYEIKVDDVEKWITVLLSKELPKVFISRKGDYVGENIK